MQGTLDVDNLSACKELWMKQCEAGKQLRIITCVLRGTKAVAPKLMKGLVLGLISAYGSREA